MGLHVGIVLKSSAALIPDKKQLQVQLGLGFEGLLSIMWGKDKQRQEHEKTGWAHTCVVKKQTTDDSPIAMYFLTGLSLSLHGVPYAAQC